MKSVTLYTPHSQDKHSCLSWWWCCSICFPITSWMNSMDHEAWWEKSTFWQLRLMFSLEAVNIFIVHIYLVFRNMVQKSQGSKNAFQDFRRDTLGQSWLKAISAREDRLLWNPNKGQNQNSETSSMSTEFTWC